MKYIKTFEDENYKNYKFKVNEYVKYNSQNNPPNLNIIYKIVNRRHKAQGWLTDENRYTIISMYNMLLLKNTQKTKMEVCERNLIKLTEEELADVKTYEMTYKFNI